MNIACNFGLLINGSRKKEISDIYQSMNTLLPICCFYYTGIVLELACQMEIYIFQLLAMAFQTWIDRHRLINFQGINRNIWTILFLSIGKLMLHYKIYKVPM